ncbi:MAG: alginate export family protein [Leptospiraceae bacterium]|nr:alginate export family protein [Leptospiraceae bacterium]
MKKIMIGSILLSISILAQEISKEAKEEKKPENTETSKPAVTEEVKPVVTETQPIPAEKKYVSSMKGDIPIEFVRSMLITPEQIGTTRKSDLFWLDNLKLGFHIRPRFESKQNFDFNKTTDDYTNYTAQTTQIWFLIDPSPYFAVKVAVQDSRLWGGSSNSQTGGDSRYGLTTSAGRDNTSTPVQTKNNTDIREAFILLKKSDILPVSIQIGRQVFAYGDLRILGPLNWLPNGYSFDGMRIMYDSKYLSSHALGVILSEQHDAPGGTISANGRRRGSIDDAYMTGTYNTIKPFEYFHIDVYAFGIHKKWIPNVNPVSSEDRSRQRDNLLTTGFRITNRIDGNKLPKGKSWDWTIESAFQSGLNGERIGANWDPIKQSYNGRQIYTERVRYDAKFLSLETGYAVLQNLRLGVGYLYGSGDTNRSDSTVGTWSPLFPQVAGSFPYWNVMNGQSLLFGFQNSKSYSFRINYKTEKAGTFIFTYYDVLKAKNQDAWYNVAGAAVSDGSSENFSNDRFGVRINPGRRLGFQYDITWIWNFSDYISIWAGASIVHAGDAIRNQRDNPNNSDPLKRYTFDPNAKYFFLMVTASL